MTKAQQECIGKRYGRLTVISLNLDKIKEVKERTHKTYIFYNCKCDCGNYSVTEKSRLKSGNTKSCGCYEKECKKTNCLKHGAYSNFEKGKRERLYSTYSKMKQRCYNKNNKDYNYYGGRGILICDEWLDKENGYEIFREWSLNNGYTDDLTIDRIDVNGNYKPSNCRWVDMKTQMNNTRQNHMITYNGKTQSLTMWSEELDIPYSTLKEAINGRPSRNKKNTNYGRVFIKI